MLSFEELPINRDQLVELLGQRLNVALQTFNVTAESVALRESIRVWRIDDRPETGESIASQATRTELWHHQIWINGEPRLWVRSRSDGKGGWHIGEVVDSVLAAALNRVLEVLDREDLGTGEIRYLTVPRLQLEAIWVWRPEGDLVSILAAPREVKTELGNQVVFHLSSAHDESQEAQFVSPDELGNVIRKLPDFFGLRTESTE